MTEKQENEFRKIAEQAFLKNEPYVPYCTGLSFGAYFNIAKYYYELGKNDK